MSKKAQKTATRQTPAAPQTQAPAAGTSVSTQTAPLPVVGAKALPPGIKLVRRITLPSLALKKAGESRILAIADAMRISNIQDKPDAEGRKREPATICTVGDVQTGEAFTFIVPAVVKANLNRDYPNESYVGKAFLIEHMGKRNESQRYSDFSLSEVDVSGLTAAAETGNVAESA